MPMYEYRCDSCGNEFEKLQKMSDSPLKNCPVCDKASLSKLVSAAGFQLKGSGWYVTDFKNKKSLSNEGQSSSTENSKHSPDSSNDGKGANEGDKNSAVSEKKSSIKTTDSGSEVKGNG